MNRPSFKCALCQGAQSRNISKKDCKSGRELDVRICLSCGLVQQFPLPESADLQHFYSHHYREEYKGSFEPRPKHTYRATLAAIDRLNFLKKSFECLPRRAHGVRTIFDIGAGGGEFLYLASRAGYNASGIEPNIGYSEFARNNYEVGLDTLSLDDVTHLRADCITLFHVLEHLPSLTHTLGKLHQMTQEGGSLCLEVPNIEQADASPANIYFRAHLFYFSEATLISAASSFFEPVSIDSKGNLRILFKRRDSPLPPRLPQTEQVQQTLERLTKKGWMEYLTRGGGLSKPARRIRQYWIESQLKGLTPCEIVERALADSRLAHPLDE